MSKQQDLPSTHRALVQKIYGQAPSVQILPTPAPVPGSAIVRILFANVLTYMRDIYDGSLQYPYPVPLTLGTAAIGRIAAVGSDATILAQGQLVLVDDLIRGRDDPTALCLNAFHEGFTAGSRKLMRDEWRNGTFAQYAKVPLENCHVLNEKRLLSPLDQGGLGYAPESLAMISKLVITYGGLSSIDVRAGETIVIAPATGMFGSAAVQVALGMGAGLVIAMGRNESVLGKVKAISPSRVATILLTGDLNSELAELQKYAPIDAFFEMSPHKAKDSTHINACILALRRCGRICIMGGRIDDVSLPYSKVMHADLTLKGKWMYERKDVPEVIRLVELGVLKLGGEQEGSNTGIRGLGNTCFGKFKLEQWERAFEMAKEASPDGFVVIEPDA